MAGYRYVSKVYTSVWFELWIYSLFSYYFKHISKLQYAIMLIQHWSLVSNNLHYASHWEGWSFLKCNLKIDCCCCSRLFRIFFSRGPFQIQKQPNNSLSAFPCPFSPMLIHNQIELATMVPPIGKKRDKASLPFIFWL